MGQLSSSVGLISGLPTADIIDQLLAIEARPKQLVDSRIAVLQSQQVAFQDINARMLALKLSANGFTTDQTFDTTTATSSNDSVLTATSGTSSTPGTYNFIVDRLVTTQQMVTRGFADQDATTFGPATLTFEFGDARLDSDTELSTLNGGSGITRGRIQITDRSGDTAVVDLSRALTAADVLEAINDATGISVTATTNGDRFRLTDTSGASATDLAVSDVGGSGTAASLGLDATAVGDTLNGDQVVLVTGDTTLDQLNDGLGVDIDDIAGSHLQIVRRNGDTVDVDLGGATTMADVIDAVNTQSAGAVVAEVGTAGVNLQLTDTGPDLGVTFEVLASNGSEAAIDLGILGADTDADGTIIGDRVLAGLDSKLVRNLNGGSGADLGTIRITNRAGVSTDVNLASAGSLDEVVSAVNDAGADVVASLNQAGNGLLLADQTGATASDLIVVDFTGTAAVDLNLAGSHASDTVDSGNLQLRYMSERTRLSTLNGGVGMSRGRFVITDSDGVSATVDLTQGNEVTIQDVLDEINSRGLQVTARINDNGDGMLLQDTGTGAVALQVEEDGSTTAADLGILGAAASAGDDLDGSFEHTVSIEATDTLSDVATTINEAGLDVAATIINDGSATAPYRLSLTSARSGRAGAFVFDDGGLEMQIATLTRGRDGAVFFGSDDPASGVAIRTPANSLTSVIPGATIDLHSTSAGPVELTIARDDTSVVDAVRAFVDDFNDVMDTLDNYDTYNAETEERGLLLGDSTISIIRSSLYRLVNATNSDLSGQYDNLTQIGIRVGAGARLVFDSSRFESALANDRDAVQAVFTFEETETDADTNELTTTAAGIGVRFEQLLEDLTDATSGALQLRVDAIQSQVDLGNTRIEQLDELLDAKRAHLEAQFLAMERVLAQLQSQSSALTSLQSLAQSMTA